MRRYDELAATYQRATGRHPFDDWNAFEHWQQHHD
jgi:aminoglycoside phosphotransferase (APT) family kinase protein